MSTIVLWLSYFNCSVLLNNVFLSAANWYASAVLWSNFSFNIDYVFDLSSKFFDIEIISFSCDNILLVWRSDCKYFVFNNYVKLSVLAYASNNLLACILLLVNIDSLS